MNSPMKHLRISLSVLFIAALAAPFAFGAGADVLEGTYNGSAKGLKATVEVDEDGDGSLRYALKSECGKSKGSIDLDGGPSGLKGSRGSDKSSVSAQFKDDDGDLDGLLKHKTKTKGKDGRVERCTDNAEVTAELDAKTAPVIVENVGHYEGTGEDGGHPVSFDVAYDAKAGELEIKNMVFDTDTECYDDYDGDGEDDTLVVKASGLEGSVDEDGYFDLDSSPNDETDFYAEGVLEDGEAEMDVEVGGYFNADGTANEAGTFECDSFGEVYRATKG